MIEPHKVADVARYGHNSNFSGELAMKFRRHLAAVVPPGARWIWPHLLETLPYVKGKAGDEARKPFVRAIRRLREQKALGDCWEYCPTRTYLGSPLVLWRNPKGDDQPSWQPPSPGPSQF